MSRIHGHPGGWIWFVPEFDWSWLHRDIVVTICPWTAFTDRASMYNMLITRYARSESTLCQPNEVIDSCFQHLCISVENHWTYGYRHRQSSRFRRSDSGGNLRSFSFRAHITTWWQVIRLGFSKPLDREGRSAYRCYTWILNEFNSKALFYTLSWYEYFFRDRKSHFFALHQECQIGIMFAQLIKIFLSQTRTYPSFV